MKESEDPKSQVLSNQKAASAMEPWIGLLGLSLSFVFLEGMTFPTLRDENKKLYIMRNPGLTNDFYGNVRCFIEIVSGGWIHHLQGFRLQIRRISDQSLPKRGLNAFDDALDPSVENSKTTFSGSKGL